MKGLSLITDFSDGREVGKRLYMDEHLGISEEESRQTDFEAYGKKVLAEGNCRILPCGVFVMQGFKMQEVYNGRTFPEYIYDADQTVAVLKIKNKEGNRDYLYLPTDIYSVNMMKERLRVQDLWECSVEEVHNLWLSESLVPEPEKLRCAEELTFFNEMCHQVNRFDAGKMERLAMAVELVGAEVYYQNIKEKTEELEKQMLNFEDKMNQFYVNIISIMAVFVAIFALININIKVIADTTSDLSCVAIITCLLINLSAILTIGFMLLLIKWIIISPLKRQGKVAETK